MDTLEHGMYYKPQARFQKTEFGKREDAAIKTLFERKHFPEILALLYREKSIRQKDIVEALGISKGVVCLNMNELDAVGFIRQQKEGRCKTYHLLRKGAEYYETYFLSHAKPESVPDTLENILDRIDGAIEELYSLKEALQSRQEEQPKQEATVLSEKNFAAIMQVLYETGDILLSDLCVRLNRPHGNVYRDMRNLTQEGFVKKETVKHCNYYTLSEMGKEYCRERFAG